MVLHVCSVQPLCMPEAAANLVCERGLFFLQCISQLAAKSLASRVRLWKLRPKCHYFAESLLYLRQSLENPLKSSCQNEEDLMGKIKRIALKTHRSTQSDRALQRYGIFLMLHWRGIKARGQRP